MDIGDIIKDYFWVILALLFYLLAGRKKTKKDGKTVPEIVERQQGGRERKPGLQERLEQALKEMQEQAEGKTRPAQSSPPAPVRGNTVAAVPAEGTLLESVPVEPPFEFHSTVPLHQRKTALDATLPASAGASAPVPASEFREGHGLHYHAHTAEMEGTTGITEFHEAHGIRGGRGGGRPAPSGSAAAADVSRFFVDEDELRRSVIAAEVLGPPVSRRRS